MSMPRPFAIHGALCYPTRRSGVRPVQATVASTPSRRPPLMPTRRPCHRPLRHRRSRSPAYSVVAVAVRLLPSSSRAPWCPVLRQAGTVGAPGPKEGDVFLVRAPSGRAPCKTTMGAPVRRSSFAVSFVLLTVAQREGGACRPGSVRRACANLPLLLYPRTHPQKEQGRFRHGGASLLLLARARTHRLIPCWVAASGVRCAGIAPMARGTTDVSRRPTPGVAYAHPELGSEDGTLGTVVATNLGGRVVHGERPEDVLDSP
jgi:hypothetical protein